MHLKAAGNTQQALQELHALIQSRGIAKVWEKPTTLPDANIRAVVLGSRIRMITAENLCMHSMPESETLIQDYEATPEAV